MSDLSRVEQLLRNALGEDIYEVTPQSRVEALLVELNELIEGMGGSVSPEDIATAVSAYLSEHLTNPTNPPLDTSLTIANAAADSKATGDKLSELKEGLNIMRPSATFADVGKALIVKAVADGVPTAFEYGEAGTSVELDDTLTSPTEAAQAKAVGDELFEDTSVETLMAVTATALGWRLVTDSNCVSDNYYKMDKYRVTAGDSLKIISDDLFQFQTTERVPAQGNTSRVGETYGSGTFILTVPATATYLIVSTLRTDSQSAVYSVVSARSSRIDMLDSRIDALDTASSEDVGKIPAVKTVANGRVTEWEFADLQVDVDATLSQTGSAADAEAVGYKLCDICDELDNISYIYGKIKSHNGAWDFDTTHKNVYDSTFYAVDDYIGIQKKPSDAYSLNVYFYSQASQSSFVGSKNLLDVDRYLFTSGDEGYYFRIHVVSNTDSTLDTSTRYVRLFTSQKATVESKNEDKRNAIVVSKGFGQSNFTLLVSTDIHGDAIRMLNAVDYLNNNSLLDAGACLGDIKRNNTARFDYYINAVLNAEKTFFTVVGNHDVGEGTSVTSGLTQQQIYDELIAPVAVKTGTETTTPYYYKDFADKNIRVIVLNSSDLPDTMASESAFLVDRGILGAFSQTQINWFISTLANTPSSYHVLILMHYVDAEMTADSNIHFQSSKSSWTGRTGNAYIGIINDIISAWVGGTALTQIYTSDYDNMPNVSVSADFTTRGTGVFVGFLTGHTHRDIIGKFNDYPNQIACVFTLSNMPRAGEDDLPKAAGEKSEDALTVVSVDTTNRKLYLIRVGANIATDYVERSDTCIAY